MAMQKFKELTDFITQHSLVDQCQVDDWMENGASETCSKHLGHGVRVCRFRYDAVISIERYYGDESRLLALLCVWLMDHDPERDSDDLPAPGIDIDPVDRGICNVEIRITFLENIDLVPGDTGAILFNAQRWDVKTVPVFEPNQAAVGNDPTQPTDKPYVHTP